MILVFIFCYYHYTASSLLDIFIYEDGGQGADKDCVCWATSGLFRAVKTLTEWGIVNERYRVQRITAGRILGDPSWKSTCKLLVLPGGRDLPYCQALNGSGNAKILEYVHNGGSYLGICAGAYYACSRIEFDKDNPPMSVCGNRELSFFPGLGRGPVYPGFSYTDRSGVRSVPISVCPNFTFASQLEPWTKSLMNKELYTYFNGGCEFVHQSGSGDGSPATVACYTQLPPSSQPMPSVAVVLSQCGSGRALLTGVHLEVSPEELEKYNDSLLSNVLEKLHESEHLRNTLFTALIGSLLLPQQ